MQQIKIFKTVENDIQELEAEVNAWLRQSGARVISITGNIAPQTLAPGGKASALGQSGFPASDVMLIVLYEVAEG